MSAVTLPPDLQRFVADAVAQGRHVDLDDLVRAAVSLLQRAEAERAAFIVSHDKAVAEGKRDGFITIKEVLQETDEIIEATERRRG